MRAAALSNDAAFAPADPPYVLIQFPPGARWADYELVDGAEGPHPCAVMRSLLRALGRSPSWLSAEPGDQVGSPVGGRACYLLDRMDRRIARILGLDADAVNGALIALHVARWAPGRNAEAGMHVAGSRA